ncbi:MAG: hypothetical protein DRI57_03225 [Deltaproteobacteria bacterium]|nr:MAG: hypothetical protein DRI57_03225 [Deltaproteobacteria bacterium]
MSPPSRQKMDKRKRPQTIQITFYMIASLLILFWGTGYIHPAFFWHKQSQAMARGSHLTAVEKEIHSLQHLFFEIRLQNAIAIKEKDSDAHRQHGLILKDIRGHINVLMARPLCQIVRKNISDISKFLNHYEQIFNTIIRLREKQQTRHNLLDSNHQILKIIVLQGNDPHLSDTFSRLTHAKARFLANHKASAHHMIQKATEDFETALTLVNIKNKRVSETITTYKNLTDQAFRLDQIIRNLSWHFRNISARLTAHLSHSLGNTEILLENEWQDAADAQNELRRYLFISAVAGFLILLLVIGLMSRKAMDPIRALAAMVRAFRSGNTEVRFEDIGNPNNELAQFALAFNELLDTLGEQNIRLISYLSELEDKNKEIRYWKGKAEASRAHLDETVVARTLEFRNAIADANEQARQTEKNNLAFLENLSHEIRTPLNGIIGMTELLTDTELDENQRSIFHTISTEAGVLLRIVNDVLDFSKIEAGSLVLRESVFDLRELLENMARNIAFQAEKKGLRFNLFVSPNIPERLVGDPARVRQVLLNLADNALKFTQKGGINIRVEKIQATGDQARVRFQVRDTGVGIPFDRQAAIFESFTHIDGTSARKYPGTGLGITLARQLTELMGGEIGLGSEAGKGSTFWFTIAFARQTGFISPLLRDESDAETPESGPAERTPRILLAEDYPISQKVLVKLLNQAGYQADVAVNGREAVNTYKRRYYDLILMDLQMPEMDGFEATAAIRSYESQSPRRVPIIAMTGHNMKGEREKSLKAGMSDCISKPLKQAALLAMVEKWVSKDAERAPLRIRQIPKKETRI